MLTAHTQKKNANFNIRRTIETDINYTVEFKYEIYWSVFQIYNFKAAFYYFHSHFSQNPSHILKLCVILFSQEIWFSFYFSTILLVRSNRLSQFPFDYICHCKYCVFGYGKCLPFSSDKVFVLQFLFARMDFSGRNSAFEQNIQC